MATSTRLLRPITHCVVCFEPQRPVDAVLWRKSSHGCEKSDKASKSQSNDLYSIHVCLAALPRHAKSLSSSILALSLWDYTGTRMWSSVNAGRKSAEYVIHEQQCKGKNLSIHCPLYDSGPPRYPDMYPPPLPPNASWLTIKPWQILEGQWEEIAASRRAILGHCSNLVTSQRTGIGTPSFSW